MKNYTISIYLLLFILIILASCTYQKSQEEEEDRPARGKIVATRPIQEVKDGDTLVFLTGEICIWNDSTDEKANLKPLYFKVEECEIPCTFEKGCKKEGDYVKFKKIDNSDTVKITAYEFRNK